jgi:hypothetical protein
VVDGVSDAIRAEMAAAHIRVRAWLDNGGHEQIAAEVARIARKKEELRRAAAVAGQTLHDMTPAERLEAELRARFPNIPRWRLFDGEPDLGTPYIADCRTFDVPETIQACIRNAMPGMVAITLSTRGGPAMIAAAEKAAAERGAVVVWWEGP